MNLKEQYEKLLRYCYMKTNDRILAEDIVQEAYLRFWQSHHYKDTGKEMAYLYTIARNLCTDEYRKLKNLNIEDFSDSIACGSSEQEAAITRLAIEKALGNLPEELREIVTLRYISEISTADIGKITGMSRFSVQRRLKTGLAILKKELEGEEGK
ncbi:MAG: RNA polymerase sigma factor [Agathobacter sp.]